MGGVSSTVFPPPVLHTLCAPCSFCPRRRLPTFSGRRCSLGFGTSASPQYPTCWHRGIDGGGRAKATAVGGSVRRPFTHLRTSNPSRHESVIRLKVRPFAEMAEAPVHLDPMEETFQAGLWPQIGRLLRNSFPLWSRREKSRKLRLSGPLSRRRIST